MVKILNAGVQARKLLRSCPSPESQLLSLSSPYMTVGLLNDVVTACCRNHVPMVDVSQARDLPDRGSIAPELVGMDDLWDIVFRQQPGQEGRRRFGVAMPLKENVEHEAVLVHGPPEPVANTIDARTDLIQMPAGTPTGFLVAQAICEERAEFETPVAHGFVTDLDAALVQQFLNIPITQRKAVV